MSNPATIIRDACRTVQQLGVQLRSGPWFEFEGDKVVSCCAVGAVLLASGVDVKPSDQSTGRGYLAEACRMLEVNNMWLYRFWMGFDRGYQILIEVKENTFRKDDVSLLGIETAREFACV